MQNAAGQRQFLSAARIAFKALRVGLPGDIRPGVALILYNRRAYDGAPRFGQRGVSAMSAKALFVGMQARSGKQTDVAGFLRGAREVVKQEIDTKEWYALCFDDSSF